VNRSIPLNAWLEIKREARLSLHDWNLINDAILLYRSKAEEMRIDADRKEEMISMHQFEYIF